MGESDNRAVGAGGTGGAGGDGGNGGTGGSDINGFNSGGDGGAGAKGSGGQLTRFRSNEDNETGGVAGVGAETKISRKVSAGLEGLYYAFDGNGQQDDDFFALRGRLTYHMQGDDALRDGPVIANWAGFYVGLNGGGLFNNDNVTVLTASGSGSSAGSPGGGGALAVLKNEAFGMGGGHIGFNLQRDKWVYGIEGDFDGVEDVYDYVASVSGRLGWATDNVLLYGTAGMAFARDDNFDGNVLVGVGAAGGNGGNGGPGGPGGAGDARTALVKNKDDTDVGFVIGTGTDVKLGERISIGMEGLFYGFDDDKVVFFADGKRAGSVSADNDFYVVQARLTYHLQ